jgi:hypothetical protein
VSDNNTRPWGWTRTKTAFLGFLFIAFGCTVFVQLYFETASGTRYPEGAGIGTIAGLIIFRTIQTEELLQRQWTRQKTAILGFIVTVVALLTVFIQYNIINKSYILVKGGDYPGSIFYIFLVGFVIYEIIMFTRETTTSSEQEG